MSTGVIKLPSTQPFSNSSLLQRIFFTEDCLLQVDSNPNAHHDLWDALWSASSPPTHVLSPIIILPSMLPTLMSNYIGLLSILQINQVSSSFRAPAVIIYSVWNHFYDSTAFWGAQIIFMSPSPRVFPGQSEVHPYSSLFSSLSSHYPGVYHCFICLLLSCLYPLSYQMGTSMTAVTWSACLWFCLLCLEQDL